MIRYVTFVIVLVLTGGLVYEGGLRGAQTYERMLTERVRHGLTVIDIDWVRLRADGRRIELHGRAPSIEAQKLALETAIATAPLAHIVDYSSATLTPPPKRDPILIEVLRDPDGITITGRLYGDAMKRRFVRRLEEVMPGSKIHDFTGVNAAQPTANWGSELELATLAVASLSDAYLSIAPGQIKIDGVVPDQAARDAFNNDLLSLAGPDIALDLNLRVPPRAIAPFEFSILKTFGGLRMERCAARSSDERARIATMLKSNGATEHGRSCVHGLGGPEGDWVGTIEAGLDALAKVPTGRFSVAYHEVRFEALQPTDPAEFDEVTETLRAALPEPFELQSRQVSLGSTDAVPRNGFWLKIFAEPDKLRFEGRMPGTAERSALILFAQALFSRIEVEDRLEVIDAVAPPDWQYAAQSAVEVLQVLEQGRAEISAGRLSVEGQMLNPADAGALHRDLAFVLPGFEISTAFEVDLARAIASLPLTPAACLAQMNAQLRRSPIAFATGNAAIEGESAAVLDELATMLTDCANVSIEIEGHTDSQGAEDYNKQLSQIRAEAVMDALISRGIAHGRMTAAGMGEAAPLASNATPEGRAENRRIEFRLGG